MHQPKDSIAITGIAGRFPNCLTTKELQKALFDGQDLMSDHHNRWSHQSLGTPSRLGLIHDFEYFDATFFGINPREANIAAPTLRKVLEVSYEAILDAGLNPTELRGSKTGVFLAVNPNDISDLNYKGTVTAKNIVPNLLSYCFDFKGPSVSINTACSSGLYALAQATDNILLGRCDLALVAAVQHQFDPAESVDLMKMGVLDVKGVSRPFDVNRNGFAKSEAVVAIILQKVDDSIRIYATIAGIGTNYEGFKKDMFYPSNLRQKALFEDTFRIFDIDPSEVNYVEAHCTGTRIGDVEEVKALDDFYTKGRKTPLLIGSVKSNLGHTEMASGLVSLIKVLIAIRQAVIPGNLHFERVDPEMKGIFEGRLKVVNKNIPLPPGLIAINSFGLGGANAMIILRPYKEKKQILNELSHRLVKVSGRTQEAVQVMLYAVLENKTNEQFLSLIDNIHGKLIENHSHKGYAILSNNSHYEINEASSKKRPIWYVYAGFGSQWPGMGKDLMKFEVFRNTIKKCATALGPYGVDLEAIIESATEETFKNLNNAFVGITAISVALTDMLTAFHIKPNNIIGHSLGEVACAYADGLITVEQAVVIAYWRSNAIVTSNLTPGSMASVGLSIENCKKILPQGVYIACDNSEQNVTISGPSDIVNLFLNQLNRKGIFNKLISGANYPLHSPYLEPIVKNMHSFLKNVLPDYKPRTKKWLPSALSENKWGTDLGKYNSAEYHCYNTLNQVQFRGVLKHIPKDAIVIEIAPRGLLQAILKKSLDQSVTMLSLLKPGVDNVDFFLSNIGKFYINGGQIDLTELYRPVNFPVSSDTPMISHLVKWDHRTKWHTLRYNPATHYGLRMDIDMNDQNNKYLTGHRVDGRVTLPAAGYFFLVWQAYAKMLQEPYQKLPVVFNNFETLSPIVLVQNEITAININIFRSTGTFEMRLENDQQLIATGRVSLSNEIENIFLDDPHLCEETEKLKITHDDFYYQMNLKGYQHSDIFLGIQECNLDGESAIVKWNNNWIAFIDGIVQFMLNEETSGRSFPIKFEKIIINPRTHFKLVDVNSNLLVNYNRLSKTVKCGGIEVRNMILRKARKLTVKTPPTLWRYVFVPTIDTQKGVDPFHHSLDIAGQIIVENTRTDINIKIAEVQSKEGMQILKTRFEKIFVKKTSFRKINSLNESIDTILDLIIVSEIDENILKNCSKRSRFVFGKLHNINLSNIEIVYRYDKYALIKCNQYDLPDEYVVIRANNTRYNWVDDLKSAINKSEPEKSRIYLINEDLDSGIVGLFNTIRLENYCPNLRIFLIRDVINERFSLESNFFSEQLKKDLTVNIYQDNCWGTYRFLPLEPLQPKIYTDASLVRENEEFQWIQKSPYSKKCGHVKVRFAGTDSLRLNTHEEEYLGFEYSGVDENENKVMGLVPKGALATSVSPHPILTWSIRKTMTLEKAATIPLVYTLSYYGLFIRAKLEPKDSIIIQNLRNEFNIAAASLAIEKGCTVFVVEESASEKDVLEKISSKNKNNIIMLHSKNLPFYKTILKGTHNKGVKAVFNCRSINLLKISKKCISKNGHFIEIDAIDNNDGDHDIWTPGDFMEKHFSFHNIKISDIFEEDEDVLKVIAEDLTKYLDAGIITPFIHSIYDTNPVLKLNHETKNLIKLENEILAYPRTYMNPNKCYIIVGGLGGFGFELARWLIERGATKIILNSRRNVSSGYHALWLKKWNLQGLTVLTSTLDTTTLKEAEDLLNFATKLAPVGGIFNTALVIKDDAMIHQTSDHFNIVAPAKIFVAQNMDILSRKLCKELDYFVMFSSLGSSVGNPNQANYNFVNSAVERICATRKREGFPGMAIEWGPLDDVGILVRMKFKAKILETQPQKLSSCLQVLDHFFQLNDAVLCSFVEGDEENETDNQKSLIELVADLFGIKNIKDIDDSKTLIELGMDSLLAFEIKHLLSKNAGLEIGVRDVRNITVEKIKSLST